MDLLLTAHQFGYFADFPSYKSIVMVIKRLLTG